MDRLDRELEVARAAAREAGAAIMRFYGNADVEVHSKPDLSPVTAADEAANVCLTEKIHGAFPEDGFLSEESPDDESRLASGASGSWTRWTGRVISWRRPATSACWSA